MKEELKANDLTLITIKSTHDSLLIKNNSINDVEKEISAHIKNESYVVAYMDFGVLIGKFIDGKFSFYREKEIEPKYLQRIRVFSKDEELLLWRNGTGFKGRKRIDGDGDKEIEVVEAHQLLWGTRSRSLDKNYFEVFENRAARLTLPFNDVNVDVKSKPRNRVFIKTRNYITYNKIGQAGYCDCRFVGFSDGENYLEERR
jgi:CRISPR-associated protein (TIGR03984 family)